MDDQEDGTLTVDELAAFLKARKWTVYRLAANGTIPAFKLGGTWQFRRKDLNAWIESKSVSGRSWMSKGATDQLTLQYRYLQMPTRNSWKQSSLPQDQS